MLMFYFCKYRDRLPAISISSYLDGKPQDDEVIVKQEDIPNVDKTQQVQLHYSKWDGTTASIRKIDKTEDFQLDCFKINSSLLTQNKLRLISKDEVVDNISIPLEMLNSKDTVDGYRYLLFVSGQYLNDIAEDVRGQLHIMSSDEFSSTEDLWEKPTILLDDFKERVNVEFEKLYPEIVKKREIQEQNLDKLKKMFLLNSSTISKLKFNINDSEEKILEKVYKADSEIVAKKDVEIKKVIDDLEQVDPAADNYQEDLQKSIDELTEVIPLQNRVALTQYVARRKLVLDLFDKVLARELAVQKNAERKCDEKLLHNIIFQQSSKDPSKSDLWLINEEFIYFKGCSEHRLIDITVDGERLFKDEISEAEDEFLNSLGENRKTKRPDILLFPEENKCIIIELKSIDENVSFHLNQITRYASLIRQFSRDDMQIDTFYGYLIGEAIDPDDVRMHDGEFKLSYKFDFLYRYKTVWTKNRSEGSLYMEVIKYSTLLERARLRNKIFLEKLNIL